MNTGSASQAENPPLVRVRLNRLFGIIRFLIRLPAAVFSFVCPIRVGCPRKKFLVFVEILPREFRDVVSEMKWVPEVRRSENDSAGYKSVDDAIVNAEFVGLTFRAYVKAENLFFFFGETVKTLQREFMKFCESRSIPYNAANMYGTTYDEQTDCPEERESNPLAVVLCKVADAQAVREAFGKNQEQTTKQADCCQISWGELQGFKNVLQCGHVSSAAERPS